MREGQDGFGIKQKCFSADGGFSQLESDRERTAFCGSFSRCTHSSFSDQGHFAAAVGFQKFQNRKDVINLSVEKFFTEKPSADGRHGIEQLIEIRVCLTGG